MNNDPKSYQYPGELQSDLGEIEVKWTKVPTLAELKRDLEEATESHNTQQKKVEVWLDNLNVTGNAKVKKRPGHSSVVPKLIRKQAEWRYAALSEPFLSTKTLFKGVPVTWEDTKAAEQNALLLNHQFNSKINKNLLIDEMVRADVDEGTVIFRTSWKSKEETITEMMPVVDLIADPEFEATLEEIGQLKLSNPNGYETNVPYELKVALDATYEDGVIYRPTVIGQEEVTSTRLVYNHPDVNICPSANVYTDPTSNGDAKKARFIIYSYESSKSELMEEGRYFNLDAIDVTNNTILSEPDHEVEAGMSNFNFDDDARKKFIVYEYWGFRDIDGNNLVKPIVASWVGKTLIELRDNPYPDKELPFVFVQYLPVRKSLYGEPDGELLAENQQILGALMRGVIDSMARSANGQTGMEKGMLDPTNKRKYELGKDYEYNPRTHPSAGVHMHTYPDLPPSAMELIQLQNMEAESLTGVKAYAGGLSGDALGDVATAVRGVLDAASKRELGILRRLADGMVQIGKKFASMNGEFLSEEEVVRVTNAEFVKIRKDELAGDFDFELTISTAEEDNSKAERLEYMAQTMGNTLDISFVKLMLSEAATLRKMPELAHKYENYQPEPDPMQQAIQQAELDKLHAETAEIQSRTQENYSQAGLNQAKSGTEAAKAAELGSAANNKDLEFLERESGVTQARDLEKQEAQAMGNIKLESHKAALEQGKLKAENDAKFDESLLKAYIVGNKGSSSDSTKAA